MIEFDVEVDCPFCGTYTYATITFNDDLVPHICEAQCRNCECEKTFWLKGKMDFDVDETWKKKPKAKP